MSYKTVKLGTVCKFLNGGTPSKNNSSYFEGNIALITGADITSPIVTESRSFITEEAIQESATNLVQEGTVLLVTRTSVGKVAVAGIPLCFSQDITAVLPDEKIINPKFLVHFLQSKENYFKQYQRGATIQGITREVVANAEIPLPPLAEQKRIAEVLDKADALREKRRRALQKLDTLLHSVFLEMFGDPVTNPMGWEVKKLNEISTHILNGTTPKGGEQVYVEKGITFFRSQNVWRNRLSLDDIAFIDAETHRQMRKSSLKRNDILITKTGRINTENSSLGRATIFSGKDDSANINGHVYLVRLEEGNIHKFILFILTMDEYREYIRSVCVGGIDKRQINKEHLERFPIIFPPHDLQRRFASVIELAEQQKARQRVSLKKLDDLFTSLQSRAFKGELFDNELENELTDEKKVWQQTSLF